MFDDTRYCNSVLTQLSLMVHVHATIKGGEGVSTHLQCFGFYALPSLFFFPCLLSTWLVAGVVAVEIETEIVTANFEISGAAVELV